MPRRKKKRGPRPLIPGEPMKRIVVTVDDLTIKYLDILGAKNRSKGVREAARMAIERYQTEE